MRRKDMPNAFRPRKCRENARSHAKSQQAENIKFFNFSPEEFPLDYAVVAQNWTDMSQKDRYRSRFSVSVKAFQASS